jgi:RimJ/RimL family protein N-acetyltransferase
METETETNPAPNFNLPIRVQVEHYQTGEKFTIQSNDWSAEFTEEDYERLAQIMNEPEIYNRFFRSHLEGKPYTKEAAQRAVEKEKMRWEEKTKFEFLIRDSQGQIVGGMQIKSPKLEAAEIGYWMSETTPGVMTNAIVALCVIAKEAGFNSLYGMTIAHNEKSQRVLERAGFVNEGEAEKKGNMYIKFSKQL